jgi:hypothetical protein
MSARRRDSNLKRMVRVATPGSLTKFSIDDVRIIHDARIN